CSERCSSTMRTARSRTSGENFADFFMAPFSSVGASAKPGALQFWLAVIWAGYNIEVARTCSGDNCIGYMLLAMPFPFVYAYAELLLWRARRRERGRNEQHARS
ncbi:hypothetical protein, partial [Aquabacterium sp.]|uniref:hypothetical protein n=1 Tax=Aquabacterium sp. TaxID=1872578 RepID=UPI0035B297D7